MRQLLTLIATALLAGHAGAVNIVMPPAGTRSFIALYEISSPHQTCPDIQCTIVFSPGAPLELPTASFPPSGGPAFETGSGRVDATTLSAFVSGNVATEIDLALRDTYTVTGTAVGPFPVTFHLAASGVASTVGNRLNSPVVQVTIGTLNLDPANVVPSVVAFDSTTHAQTIGNSIINGSGSEPIAAAVSYTRMVSVGDVFDVAYFLQASAARGTLDLSHTATISFDVPAGVTLVSALAPVPEPPAAALLLAGAAALWAWSRRPRP